MEKHWVQYSPSSVVVEPVVPLWERPGSVPLVVLAEQIEVQSFDDPTPFSLGSSKLMMAFVAAVETIALVGLRLWVKLVAGSS